MLAVHFSDYEESLAVIGSHWHWQSVCSQTDLRCQISLRTDIFELNPCYSYKKMIKVCSWSFQQYFWPFNMLTFKRCFETGLFRHLTNHAFRSLLFRKYITYESHLFFRRCSKFDILFRNSARNSEKVSYFKCNCIWIGCEQMTSY